MIYNETDQFSKTHTLFGKQTNGMNRIAQQTVTLYEWHSTTPQLFKHS